MAAQDADKTFISDYAEDVPNGGDVVESLLTWFAVRYGSPGSTTARDTIEAAIPNRIDYFDGLPLSTFGQLLFGDYNGDSVVDAADYIDWRKNLDSGYYLNNSGDESDDVAGWGTVTFSLAPEPLPASRREHPQHQRCRLGDSSIRTGTRAAAAGLPIAWFGVGGVASSIAHKRYIRHTLLVLRVRMYR